MFLTHIMHFEASTVPGQSRYSITPWWINKEGLKFFLEYAGEPHFSQPPSSGSTSHQVLMCPHPACPRTPSPLLTPPSHLVSHSLALQMEQWIVSCFGTFLEYSWILSWVAVVSPNQCKLRTRSSWWRESMSLEPTLYLSGSQSFH